MTARRALLAACAAALLAPSGAGAQQATKIPGPLDGPLPLFQGAAATAQPLRGPWLPQNPHLAPDGRSGSGLAAGNGAASPLPGPLGRGTTRSSALLPGNCSSLAFDRQARLLALCNGILGPVLRLVDPANLATISTLNLPPRPNADMNDRAGGTHFVVRDDGTLLVPTNQGQVLTIASGAGGLKQTGSIDLTKVLAQRERPFAIGIGADGRVWVTGEQGSVIVLPRNGSERIHRVKLPEPIAEDMATDASGTYVVTRDALYRFGLTPEGAPKVLWRHAIPAGLDDSHAGRVHPGSGTPPAILPGGYVAVTDAVDPPRLMVLRTTGPTKRRLYCSVPLFTPGRASVEAPLTVAGHSVVVTNAYGYDGLQTTELGGTTTGGIARVVVGRRGCRTAWTSPEISPSAQPVVSRATGLLYTTIKPAGAPDNWRLAGIDWRTGAKRFSVLSGEGLGFNSTGGAVVLGPDGAAYAGTFGGVVRFQDRASR